MNRIPKDKSLIKSISWKTRRIGSEALEGQPILFSNDCFYCPETCLDEWNSIRKEVDNGIVFNNIMNPGIFLHQPFHLSVLYQHLPTVPQPFKGYGEARSTSGKVLIGRG